MSARGSCRGRGAQQPELADLGGVLHQFCVHPGEHVGEGVLGVVLPGEWGRGVQVGVGEAVVGIAQDFGVNV
jgi:hypothetical protein